MSTGEFGNLTNCGGVIRDGKVSIGVRAPSDLGVGGIGAAVTFLPEKVRNARKGGG